MNHKPPPQPHQPRQVREQPEKPPTPQSPDSTSQQPLKAEVKKKLWYCKQCGYVVFREDPPYICPICKAKREMFEEIETFVEFTG